MVQKKCKQCGTCCRNGGPALHGEDLPLLGHGLELTDLICVRLGEMSHNPLTGQTEPAAQEFIKVTGKSATWECVFLAEANLCQLHPHKPLECRMLECWQPQGLLALLGQDLVTRVQLLPSDSPLLPVIEHHDEQCPFTKLHPYLLANRPADESLEELLAVDLKLRQQAGVTFKLSLAQEMFYFGRPFFMTLQGAGWRIWEENGQLRARKQK